MVVLAPARSEEDRVSPWAARLVGLLAVVALVLAVTASSSRAAEPLYGVTASRAVDGGDATTMAAGGVDVVRVGIAWSAVQRRSGAELDWRGVDRSIGAVASEGIEIVPYIYGAPRWATRSNRPAGCDERLSRAGSKQWGRFVAAAAARYGSGGTFWGERGALPGGPVQRWQILRAGDPHRYGPRAVHRCAHRFEVAGRRVRSVDPAAELILGGPRSSPSPGGAQTRAWRFTNHLIAAIGGGEHLGVSFEPRSRSIAELRKQIDRVSKALDRRGRDEVGLWVAPIGWASDRHSSRVLSVGRPGQRRRLSRSFRLLRDRSNEWNVEGVVWSAWTDPRAHSSWESRSGLFNGRGKAKPSWRAFRAIADAEPGTGPAESRSFFGVSPAEAPTQSDYDLMAESGVGTVRFLVAWEVVHPAGVGSYDWTATDQEFEQIALHGIEPLPVLMRSPSDMGELLNPAGLSGWGAFVRAAVDRYGPGGDFWSGFAATHPGAAPMPAHVWQVWNEENAKSFWPRTPSPGNYAKLLDVSAGAIRAADPSAEVMIGGMVGQPRSARSINAVDFLSGLYAIGGAREDFDLVALHPYAADLGGVQQQIEGVRDVMARAGDARTGTWVTEIGWSSVPDPRPEWAGFSRTAEGQAEILRGVGRLLVDNAEAWRLRGVVWYTWRDPALGNCPFCGDAGLLLHDGTPKPSLAAFAQLAHGSPAG